MQRSIVTTWSEKPKVPLARAFPNEVRFFKKRFVWAYQTGGFYVRTGYEKVLDFPKWRPVKTEDGRWQHLYTELVDNFVEKHLDFDRHCLIRGLKQPEYELAFWLGQMCGEYTYNDCIDIDSHDVIGWKSVSTRWHPIRLGPVLPGDMSWRSVPVVRPSLRFFQIAKLVYDNFPKRIWAFSSANLGFAVWAVYPERQLAHVKHRQATNLLRRIGLSAVEHYPCPPVTKGSFGKCHRRPCGMDSGVITNDGVIVDSIEQVRCYMRPPRTPSFGQIVRAWFGQLSLSYEAFLEGGESVDHQRMTDAERKEVVEECLADVRQIKHWMKSGCPINRELIAELSDDEVQSIAEPSPEFCQLGSCSEKTATEDEYPDCFWQVDLKAISGSGQWVQFVRFLVDVGFPCHDAFLSVISTLAKWFLFVELHGQDQREVEELLCQYVAQKHNGKVTRWLEGSERDVFGQVRRIVDNVSKHESDEGRAVFDDIRLKRELGRYKNQYAFADSIRSSSSSFSTPPLLPSHLIRGGIREEDSQDQGWSYIPDETPLPDPLRQQLLAAFQQAKRPLRRRNGDYPTLLAITRFFNYLISGRKPGQRRASKKLLHEMGFPRKTNEQQAVMKVLVPTFVHKGDYRSRTRSRLWILDKTVLEVLTSEVSTTTSTTTGE